jgi:hypothetical protein
VDASNYRKSLLEQPQGEIALADLTRNFSHWFFDLLRNFVLVGGLRYFAEKSGSAVLWTLHMIALFVILLYCLSYADQWYVNVFGFLEDRRLAHWLNRILNISIAVVLLFVIGWAAHVIVGEIAHAQL